MSSMFGIGLSRMERWYLRSMLVYAPPQPSKPSNGLAGIVDPMNDLIREMENVHISTPVEVATTVPAKHVMVASTQTGPIVWIHFWHGSRKRRHPDDWFGIDVPKKMSRRNCCTKTGKDPSIPRTRKSAVNAENSKKRKNDCDDDDINEPPRKKQKTHITPFYMKNNILLS